MFKNYIGCVDNVCNDTVGVVGVVKTGIGVEGICWCVCLGGDKSSCLSRSLSLPGRHASNNASTLSSVGPQRAVPAAFCNHTTNVPCAALILTSPL